MAELRWPPDIQPAASPVYERRALRITAPPDVVWRWLVRAADWERWYTYCKRLRFDDGRGPDLAMGTRFTWSTLGVTVTTTVTEFEPPHRLAWGGTGLGARGYHGWLLDPVDGGCHVVTEEAQAGLLPSLLRVPIRRLLGMAHDRWLADLATVATRGAPPAA